MESTKFILRIIFKTALFLALAYATYWLYVHPEHEYHGWYVVTAIWAFFAGGDIGDDLRPQSLAPWNRSE